MIFFCLLLIKWVNEEDDQLQMPEKDLFVFANPETIIAAFIKRKCSTPGAVSNI